ncbi:MAG: phosphatase [Oscillospiraceae bacterium]
MRIIADLHTHTLFSTHAFSTFSEMVSQAKALGMNAIAITDHGPAMPDTGHIWHFHNSNQLPKVIDGTLVLFGAEANLLNTEGEVDIPVNVMQELDWIIVSMHKELIPSLTKEQANKAWLAVAENPYVDMIGHCEQVQHEFDIDVVIPAFAKNNKVVEMNGNSANVRPAGKENMRKIALACKKYGCKIAINSDAHSMYKIGDVQKVADMIEDIDFPKELIINADWQQLKNELKLHNKSIIKFI